MTSKNLATASLKKAAPISEPASSSSSTLNIEPEDLGLDHVRTSLLLVTRTLIVQRFE